MTPEQLAELFIEDKHDILPNIMADIETLVKNAYKSGYACAVDKTEEWLSENIYEYLDMPYESFITAYLKEIQLWAKKTDNVGCDGCMNYGLFSL